MISERNVKEFCCEDLSLIENYEEAISSLEIWDCHHRLEIQGDIRYSRRQLIEMKQYYDRPASELIFLTHSDHTRLHFTNFKRKPFSKKHREKLSECKIGNQLHLGCKHSDEARLKMSKAHKGKSTWMKGKKHSLESIQKMRESHKGNTAHLWCKHSDETKLKMRLKRLGKSPNNKGKKKVWNDESHTKFHYE